MRYLISTLLLLAISTALIAADKKDEAKPDWSFKSKKATAALKKHNTGVAKINKESEAAIKKQRLQLVMDLEKARKDAFKKEDIDEIIKIDAAIKALKKGASPAGASVAGSKGKKKPKKSKARIPRNAVKWNGHHYLLSDIIMSHPEAKQRCEIAGGHLVRIENAREQEFVGRLASKGAQKLSWIDGSDRKREGDWLFSDGTRMKFFYWQPGEPNGKTLENYINMVHKSGLWIDSSSPRGTAEWTTGFICEWDE